MWFLWLNLVAVRFLLIPKYLSLICFFISFIKMMSITNVLDKAMCNFDVTVELQVFTSRGESRRL